MSKETFILPMPPTINTYWRCLARAHMALSSAGRGYKRIAQRMIEEQATVVNRDKSLKVQVLLIFDDDRKHDVDNYLKAILDAFTAAQVWIDDSQVKRIEVEKTVDDKGGSCIVVIEDYGLTVSGSAAMLQTVNDV